MIPGTHDSCLLGSGGRATSHQCPAPATASSCPSAEPRHFQSKSDLDFQIGLFHREKQRFFVITSPSNPIVLGLPWLQLHDPVISWKEGELRKRSTFCQENCFHMHLSLPCLSTSVERPESSHSITLSKEYSDLQEVFSKENGAKLPLHQPWDCTIELLPNTMPPKSHVYPLSLPEKSAMDVCICI